MNIHAGYTAICYVEVMKMDRKKTTESVREDDAGCVRRRTEKGTRRS